MKYTFDYRNQTISEVLKTRVFPKTTYVGMTTLELLVTTFDLSWKCTDI